MFRHDAFDLSREAESRPSATRSRSRCLARRSLMRGLRADTECLADLGPGAPCRRAIWIVCPGWSCRCQGRVPRSRSSSPADGFRPGPRVARPILCWRSERGQVIRASHGPTQTGRCARVRRSRARSKRQIPCDAASAWRNWRSGTVRRTSATCFTDSFRAAPRSQVERCWVARRNRVNPPSSTITFLNRRSPACAPNAGPRRAATRNTNQR